MTIDLYPSLIHEGDLSPDAFGEQVDNVCHEIHASVKGFGTDEERLLNAMGGMTPEMRCKVPIRYKELYGDNLEKVMKSECGSRDFGTALQFLAVDPVEAECDMLKRAMKGIGTSEDIVYSILCSRTNREMEILKKKFFALEDKDLGRALDSELGGDFEKLIFNVIQAAEEEYDEDYHNEDKMKEDAAALYEMGQGSWGTHEAGLFKILCARPAEYLKKLNLLYAEKYGFTLIKCLETELRGHTKKAAMYMLEMKVKPYEAIAKLIRDACAGAGTNELLLTTTLIRNQMVLKDVMPVHIELYGKTIEDRVKEETKRDYEKLLLKICETAMEL